MESELPVVTSALERGANFDLRPEQWARPLWILYGLGMESLEI